MEEDNSLCVNIRDQVYMLEEEFIIRARRESFNTTVIVRKSWFVRTKAFGRKGLVTTNFSTQKVSEEKCSEVVETLNFDIFVKNSGFLVQNYFSFQTFSKL